MAYNWRELTTEQRTEILLLRQNSGQPWHGPPHGLERQWYHVSAACFEHHPVAGKTPRRLQELERELVATLAHSCEKVSAWCVLPNHYHFLVQCRDLQTCRSALGKLHGVLSRQWNVEDDTPGRKCWYRCLPKSIKNTAHRWATMNYIHHNPVHHGYVGLWQDWPFGSAARFLAEMGHDEAAKFWRQYPILNMGDKWDPPDL